MGDWICLRCARLYEEPAYEYFCKDDEGYLTSHLEIEDDQDDDGCLFIPSRFKSFEE